MKALPKSLRTFLWFHMNLEGRTALFKIKWQFLDFQSMPKLEGQARGPIFLRARKLLCLYLVSFDNLFFFSVNWALMIQTDRTKRLFNRFTKKCKIHGGRIKLLANLRQSLNCSIIPMKWNCKSDTKGSCWFVFPSIYLFLIPLLSSPLGTLKNVLISMWKPFILKLIFYGKLFLFANTNLHG